MKQECSITKPSACKRVAALIAAGALAASCIGAPMAFAAEITPSAGGQTGTGATEVTIQLKNAATEAGGAGTEGNPDADHDGYGDNIAFSVPTSINFVADGAGKLSGPTNAAIENHSKFSIHASSLKVDAASGWNIVSDASAATQANAIDFQVGPTTDMLDASAYLSKTAVSAPAAWNMAANTGTVALDTAGDINNVTSDITAQTKVATLHWYVTPGAAS